MKKSGYVITIILMVLMVVVSAVFIALMPEQVPVHYSLSGEADRFGSKYENIVFPLSGILLGVILLVSAKLQRKKENGNEKTFVAVTNLILLILNILQAYFLWTALSYQNGDKIAVAEINIVTLIIGGMFILIGNIMPKITRNGMVGVRLPWLMNDDNNWQKGQRFGAFVLVVSGLLLIVDGLFFKATVCSIIMLVILIASVVITCIGTYIISKKEIK